MTKHVFFDWPPPPGVFGKVRRLTDEEQKESRELKEAKTIEFLLEKPPLLVMLERAKIKARGRE